MEKSKTEALQGRDQIMTTIKVHIKIKFNP